MPLSNSPPAPKLNSLATPKDFGASCAPLAESLDTIM